MDSFTQFLISNIWLAIVTAVAVWAAVFFAKRTFKKQLEEDGKRFEDQRTVDQLRDAHERKRDEAQRLGWRLLEAAQLTGTGASNDFGSALASESEYPGYVELLAMIHEVRFSFAGREGFVEDLWRRRNLIWETMHEHSLTLKASDSHSENYRYALGLAAIRGLKSNTDDLAIVANKWCTWDPARECDFPSGDPDISKTSWPNLSTTLANYKDDFQNEFKMYLGSGPMRGQDPTTGVTEVRVSRQTTWI